MFSGFWSWVVVILVVAAIMFADKLPALRKILADKFNSRLEAALEKARELERKTGKKSRQENEDDKKEQ